MTFGLEKSVIDRVTAVLSSFPEVEEALLYGSRAMGTQKPGSDLDLTLKGPRLSLEILNKIRDQLDDLSLPYTFDLSLFSQIDNTALIEHIRRVGRSFYRKAAD